MSPLTVFLLLSVVSHVASDTLFVFSGQVTCRLNRQFSYRIVVIEEDWPYDQVLKAGGIAYFQTSPSFYNITTSDSTDGWTSEYELRFQVHHDCNSNGDKYHLNVRYNVGDYAITHGTHYITYNMDLTNQGDYWPSALKFSSGEGESVNE